MIYLSKEVLEYIIADGKSRYPEESCGIIFGSISESGEKTAEYAEAVTNGYEQAEKYHRFEITPEIMMKAELTARKKGSDIIGFYHSHPDCEAFPSEFDRSQALPVYSYLITSVINGEAAATRSFVLSSETNLFSEEKIILKEQTKWQ
ncbi:MAG: Mov34/MPN/PAD-1 family protein [Ruminiclostridium sp.]